MSDDKMLKKIKFHLEKALEACDEAYGGDEEDAADESDPSDEEESADESPKKKSSKVDLAIAFMGPKDKK